MSMTWLDSGGPAVQLTSDCRLRDRGLQAIDIARKDTKDGKNIRLVQEAPVSKRRQRGLQSLQSQSQIDKDSALVRTEVPTRM